MSMVSRMFMVFDTHDANVSIIDAFSAHGQRLACSQAYVVRFIHVLDHDHESSPMYYPTTPNIRKWLK